MFNTISWQAYWMAIAFITAGYYGVVFLLYFRKNISFSTGAGTAGTLRDSSTQSDHTSMNGTLANEFSSPAEGSSEHLVYACMDEINAYIQEAKRTKADKENFLLSLRRILSKYPAIKATEYKEAITSVLISEAAHHCSIHLSEAEVDSVWLG